MKVSEDTKCEADFKLVQACLEGSDGAIAVLKSKCGPELKRYLIASGASPTEADEIVCNLWADCSIGDGARGPRFLKYRGHCPVVSWLKALALHELIDIKRRLKRHPTFSTDGFEDSAIGDVEPSFAAAAMTERAEQPLLAIMKNALHRAFARCTAAEFVMLQLIFINGVTQRELGALWHWHESKVSRCVDAAMQQIAVETLRVIKMRDPWLEITWTDFLDLCRCVDFSLF